MSNGLEWCMCEWERVKEKERKYMRMLKGFGLVCPHVWLGSVQRAEGARAVHLSTGEKERGEERKRR